MNILVTGGGGFVGTNLALRLAALGHRVTVFDNRSRKGVPANTQRWEGSPRVKLVEGDVRDYAALRRATEGAQAVFHLAAQVAVTTSVADPRLDFEVNALGTLNALEAAREAGSCSLFVFTSTNKVYGALEGVSVADGGNRYLFRDCPQGIAESFPLDFHSPYGCSKGAADQYVRDYYRIYGLPTVVARMSCIYGRHQFGTEDQGWVAHFAISALLGRPLTIYGDGKQVRDILWVDDLVAFFEAVLEKRPAGRVYNLGGGAGNTVSLLELIALLEGKLGKKVKLSFVPWRPGDQKVYVSDVSRARQELNWCPTTSVSEGVDKLLEWVGANRGLFA